MATLSSFLLGKSKEVDSELDSLFRSAVRVLGICWRRCLLTIDLASFALRRRFIPTYATMDL